MQIRPETDVLAQYGSPSRPISPASIPTPHKKTTMATGNERAGIENHTTESQAELEPRIQQQHSATLPSQLFPPELIDHIVDHLHDDKQSLIQCSKSSRVFSHATSYHLFRAVSIPSLQKCIEFQELISSSLHPLPSNSTPHLSSSPVPRATHHEAVPTHHDSSHLHPNTDRAYVHSHTRHTCASNYDLSIPGWDISKFVRKIEFLGLGSPSAIEDYVKLVKMLPRIREVAFGWWNKSAGLERIGRAFATISSANPSHHGSLPNQSFSSPSTNAFPETRAHAGDPLKVHLELVDFPSALTFLDFLGSFGGRVRELSLANVVIGGDDKDDIRGRFLPEIESVCLGYDALVKPTAFGRYGPTKDPLFGILERIAPNVRELHLFRDDVGEASTCFRPTRTPGALQLPDFRELKSVTMTVLGPYWSDLICEIATWFARDKSCGKIADPASRASPPSSVTASLPSSDQITRADLRKNRKRITIEFSDPVRKGDVDWEELESAVSGEDIEVKLV